MLMGTVDMFIYLGQFKACCITIIKAILPSQLLNQYQTTHTLAYFVWGGGGGGGWEGSGIYSKVHQHAYRDIHSSWTVMLDV